MNITIRAAEKKLSSSMIAQMGGASTEILEDGIPLGYVNLKESYLLIEHKGNYFKHSMGWRKWDDRPRASRQIGKWSQATNPNLSEEEFTRWWTAYSKMRDEAEQIYI